VCHGVAMRLHITLDDRLVEALDRRVGPRGRSRFISESVRHALEDERRWEDIEAAIGSVAESGHDWDEDPAAWVREQRHADARRVG
jgi:metal-responsive CopG/Arc/MetJ family transcriptional regulator